MEQITDSVHRKAIETMIKTWGQTPKQLFKTTHPLSQQQQQQQQNQQPRKSLTSSLSATAVASTVGHRDSIHRLVSNVKWGAYVGSLDQIQAPVCVWKESSKKNIVALVSLASGEVVGLSQYKCLLLDRAKDSGILFISFIIEFIY